VHISDFHIRIYSEIGPYLTSLFTTHATESRGCVRIQRTPWHSFLRIQ